MSYHVRGATFTLQLPDGRAAVVNCESKYTPRGDAAVGVLPSLLSGHRDCRMPLVESIQAEFHGDKAKLIWPVSLDGKKMQSETYKVLAILDKPKSEQKSQQGIPTESGWLSAWLLLTAVFAFGSHSLERCSSPDV